ncbi:MAG: hypothetical protein ACREEB_11585 [Caulobacteraceae bacterium]
MLDLDPVQAIDEQGRRSRRRHLRQQVAQTARLQVQGRRIARPAFALQAIGLQEYHRPVRQRGLDQAAKHHRLAGARQAADLDEAFCPERLFDPGRQGLARKVKALHAIVDLRQRQSRFVRELGQIRLVLSGRLEPKLTPQAGQQQRAGELARPPRALLRDLDQAHGQILRPRRVDGREVGSQQADGVSLVGRSFVQQVEGDQLEAREQPMKVGRRRVRIERCQRRVEGVMRPAMVVVRDARREPGLKVRGRGTDSRPFADRLRGALRGLTDRTRHGADAIDPKAEFVLL